MEIVSLRGFEKICKTEFEKSETHISYDEIQLPKRATKFAAGYDVKSTLNFTLKPGEEIVIPTGFKAYMQPGEMLALFPRSGMGFKYQIQLANTVGIGDGDYYNCESNEGHYFIKLVNRGKKDWEVKVGDGIAQAIFMPILLADDDDFENGEERKGGFGSTDKIEKELCSKARNPRYNVVLDECHEMLNKRENIISSRTVQLNESINKKLDLRSVIEVDSIDNLSAGMEVLIVDSNLENVLALGMVSKIMYGDNKFIVREGNSLNQSNICEYSFDDKNIKIFKGKEDDICKPKLDGFIDVPVREDDRYLDTPQLIKDYINRSTGDVVYIHGKLVVGQPVLACSNDKTKIYYVGVINSINKEENTLCISTYLDNGNAGTEIHNLNDPKVTILTYNAPDDVTKPEPSGSLKICSVKYLNVKDNVYVTFALNNEILLQGIISKIEGNKITILLGHELNEKGTVVVDLNTEELKVFKKSEYDTLESVYPGIDIKSATSYFNHNMFTEIKDIKTLKKGNFIFGVEQYGPRLRVCSGQVGEVYDDYISIMANDSYGGARGTHINKKYGRIFKISLEDIYNGEFKNKAIDYIVEEVTTK